MRLSRAAIRLLLLPLLGGCAALSDQAASLPPGAEPIELEETPFYPQARYQCGPAALATVLDASGVDVELPDLVERVYLPGRRGSLKAELLAAARTSGRVAYVIPPNLAAIHAELDAGRPVLVLQNLGIAAFPRWHYAVVVGLSGNSVVLRSGTDRRRLTPLKTFLRTWQRSDFWGMVTLHPGEQPAADDKYRYLRAAAAFEQVGLPSDVRAAWRVAVAAWPDSEPALFGLANAHYAAGDLELAERAYRELLGADADIPAVRNNLAMTLAGLGRYDDALAEIERAISDSRSAALAAEFEETRATILERMASAGDMSLPPGPASRQ